MTKREYFNLGNKDEYAKCIFAKAVDFAIAREFGKAYEFLREGLDIITCDCDVVTKWRKGLEGNYHIFNDIENGDANHSEYFFVKGFLLAFEKDKKLLYSALDAIERYMGEDEDELGYYVKGKIYFALEDYEKSYRNYLAAWNMDYCSRNQYRLGRIREERSKIDGLDNLYYAFLENPFSYCCGWNLHKYFHERGLTFPVADDEPNPLTKFFADHNEDEFKRFFGYIVDREFVYPNYRKDGREDERLYTRQIVDGFVKDLERNAHLFIPPIDTGDDYGEPDFDPNDYDEPDYDPYEDYGSSTEKYGGYNGWSDDVIDDAFEGDPENTWNVD